MRGRDDINQRVVLSEVTDVHIVGTALAVISLRDGRAVDVHVTRVSVTEGIDFSRGRLSGDTHFNEVESVGPVEFNDSETAGDFHFSHCVFRDEFTFDGARLVGDLHLAHSTFHGSASFEGGNYRGDLRIDSVEAKSNFSFHRVTVSGDVVLTDATFHGDLLQEQGLYQGAVVMWKVSVAGRARFDGVTSHGDRTFHDLTFEGPVSFRQGWYAGSTVFENVTFAGAVTFEGAVFQSEVVFRNVKFAGPVNFRGARFQGELRFEHVTFGAVDFHVQVGELTLKNVSFANQASMVLDDAQARIEDAKFAAPLTLDSTTSCRVLSLTGTDATNLVLAQVDLSACALSDAYNLDRMKVESAAFPMCPTGWSAGWRWPFAVKRSARRVVAEEAVVRVATDRPRSVGDWWPTADELLRTGARGVSAGDVARIYRQLRKAREEAKDEPGAADFYYGEMEMRRRAAPRWSGEGFVLWLYWLTSGYGLRASRAIACLVALVFGSATLMGKIGFADSHTWTMSLVYVADTATKLVGFSTSEKLTGWGVALQIVMRLAGPVLLGLAVLSIRGRTKR